MKNIMLRILWDFYFICFVYFNEIVLYDILEL